MRGAGETRRDAIAGDILSYFLRHPAAMDSFEGIVRWRVMEEMVRRTVASTEEALRGLIAEGYLQEEQVPGGKPIYRLNGARRKEAEQLVGRPAEVKQRGSGNTEDEVERKD